MSNNILNVRLTDEAKSDFLEIFMYVTYADGLEQAEVIEKVLEEKVQSLKVFPERGKYPPELVVLEIYNYRELIVHPWRIFYEINDNNVDVIAIWDGRRDIKDLLKERLLKN